MTGHTASVTERARSAWPLASAQPGRPATASHIVRDVAEQLEANPIDESPILRRREARVIEPLALERERATGFAMLGARVEQQDSVVARVCVEHREHRPLSLVLEVEVAVPGEDTV